MPQKYLAGLDDWELLGVVRSLEGGSGSRAAACELLVSRHRNLVCSCVRRYRGGTESAEDLMQVGYVGLMKAISRFDPAVGTNLAAYAQVCISGEIKRHFRDKCWPVHVNRSVQDLVLKARKATSQLTQDLGRAPTQSEMARHLGVSGDDLRDAQRAEIASRPSSLDAPLSGEPGTATAADVLGEEDRGVEHMLGMRAIAAHWGELPPREQKILLMRFDQDMTQAQIGQLLGISQMQVSRLSARALGYLRQRLLSQHKHASAASPAVPPDHEVRGWRRERTAQAHSGGRVSDGRSAPPWPGRRAAQLPGAVRLPPLAPARPGRSARPTQGSRIPSQVTAGASASAPGPGQQQTRRRTG